MKDGPSTSDSDWFARPGFIVFIAALMGVLSLAIEICLPALRYIADDFVLANPNAAQSVITVFILAFGIGHLFQGFLADRFGRKPVLLVNLGIYAAAGAACALTDSFELLLAARAVQGVAAAGSRVVGTAILRDVKDGSDLARSMSLAMMVFSGIPVLAPFIGQAAILAFGYRSVFVLLFLAPAILFAVALMRLPETWPSQRRIPIRPAAVLRSLRWLWASRDTLGYTAIAGILYGQLFGYIASAPQVFAEVFGVTTLFPIYLSLVAVGIGLAAFLNSRIVRAVGTRRVVFFALCGVLLASAGLCLAAYAYGVDLAMFQTFVMLVMFGNGMAFANCNVLAIQPHGQIAGVASSIVGGATMIISAFLSHLIGQAFDGTTVPLATSLFGLALLALIIERLTSFSGRSESPDSH